MSEQTPIEQKQEKELNEMTQKHWDELKAMTQKHQEENARNSTQSPSKCNCTDGSCAVCDDSWPNPGRCVVQ
jgi:hypothetical protein